MDPTRSRYALSDAQDPPIPVTAVAAQVAILATVDDGCGERLAMAVATARDLGRRAVIVTDLDEFLEKVERLGPHALVVSGPSSLADAVWRSDETLRHVEESGGFVFRAASGRLRRIVHGDVSDGPPAGMPLWTEAWS